MIIDKNREGAWRITDIVNDYWETRVYYFYTKREAMQKFKQEMKELKKEAANQGHPVHGPVSLGHAAKATISSGPHLKS